MQKSKKNYKTFLTFVNQTTLYGVIKDVSDPDIKELHNVAQQLCIEDDTFEHRNMESMIHFVIERRVKG